MIVTGDESDGSGEALASRDSTIMIAIGGKLWHQKPRRTNDVGHEYTERPKTLCCRSERGVHMEDQHTKWPRLAIQVGRYYVR